MLDTLDCSSLSEAEVAHALLQHERQGLPLVMRRFFSGQPCMDLWQDLRRWKELVSDPRAEVSVMVSDSSEFQGDISHHTPALITFHNLLQLHADPDTQMHIYLAQATLLSQSGPAADELKTSVLTPLTADFSIPPALRLARQCALGSLLLPPATPPATFQDSFRAAGLNQVNLWFTKQASRSSLHCDDYQNVLCMVRGRKRVRLLHPSFIHCVYPQSLFGDSMNHSAVNALSPDYTKFPLFAEAEARFETAELEPGDALFLPEGWWHQVDSEPVGEDPAIIGLNFWWHSDTELSLRKGQAASIARRSLRMLVDEEIDRTLARLKSPELSALLQSPADISQALLAAIASNSALLPQLLVSAPPLALRTALHMISVSETSQENPVLALFTAVLPSNPLVGICLTHHFEESSALVEEGSQPVEGVMANDDFFAEFYGSVREFLSSDQILSSLLDARAAAARTLCQQFLGLGGESANLPGLFQ